jgi:hypothetical protein
MERPIRGPDKDEALLSSEEAGKAAGVSDDVFDALMALHLPTLRPIWLGKLKRWTWMDCAVLFYVLTRAETPAPGRRGKASGGNEPENQ